MEGLEGRDKNGGVGFSLVVSRDIKGREKEVKEESRGRLFIRFPTPQI